MDDDGLLITSPSYQNQTDWLVDLCSFYMSIGVSFDEFWHGDPCKLKFYVKAHKYALEQENQRLWLQGLYNYKAFDAGLEKFSYGLNGGKGRQPKGYLEYPIAITDREKEAESQRKIKHTREWFMRGQKDG